MKTSETEKHLIYRSPDAVCAKFALKLEKTNEQLKKQIQELQHQRDRKYDEMLQWRGIFRDFGDKPCERCRGAGIYTYGDASTWHKKISGQVMTPDICDKCWGSGKSDEHWTNLRNLKKNISSSNQVNNGLPPLPEPSDMDNARWGYNADDMCAYAMDAYNAGVKAGQTQNLNQ